MSGRRGKGYFLPGAIALAALLAIGLFVGAGDLAHPAPRSISGHEVETQIALALQAQRGGGGLPTVRCPSSEPARAGLQFVCSVNGVAGDRHLDVTEVDARGRVAWKLQP